MYYVCQRRIKDFFEYKKLTHLREFCNRLEQTLRAWDKMSWTGRHPLKSWNTLPNKSHHLTVVMRESNMPMDRWRGGIYLLRTEICESPLFMRWVAEDGKIRHATSGLRYALSYTVREGLVVWGLAVSPTMIDSWVTMRLQGLSKVKETAPMGAKGPGESGRDLQSSFNSTVKRELLALNWPNWGKHGVKTARIV